MGFLRGLIVGGLALLFTAVSAVRLPFYNGKISDFSPRQNRPEKELDSKYDFGLDKRIGVPVISKYDWGLLNREYSFSSGNVENENPILPEDDTFNKRDFGLSEKENYERFLLEENSREDFKRFLEKRIKELQDRIRRGSEIEESFEWLKRKYNCMHV